MSLNSYRVYQNSVAFKKKMFLQPLFCLQRHLICHTVVTFPLLKSFLVTFFTYQAKSLPYGSLLTQLRDPPRIRPWSSPSSCSSLPSKPIFSLIAALSCQHFATNCSLYLLMKMLLLANSWYIKYHIEIISQNHRAIKVWKGRSEIPTLNPAPSMFTTKPCPQNRIPIPPLSCAQQQKISLLLKMGIKSGQIIIEFYQTFFYSYLIKPSVKPRTK